MLGLIFTVMVALLAFIVISVAIVVIQPGAYKGRHRMPRGFEGEPVQYEPLDDLIRNNYR